MEIVLATVNAGFIHVWNHGDTLALIPLLEAADAYARGEANLGFLALASQLLSGSSRLPLRVRVLPLEHPIHGEDLRTQTPWRSPRGGMRINQYDMLVENAKAFGLDPAALPSALSG